MKKFLSMLMVLMMLVSASAVSETTLSGNAQMIFDTIRWDINLPKSANVLRADEYLFKFSQNTTIHALLIETTTSPELEMMYGKSACIVLVNLDTGDVMDYKTFDGNVMWPEDTAGMAKADVMSLLFNCYNSYLEGYNPFVMGEFEIVMPVADAEIAEINTQLNALFVR